MAETTEFIHDHEQAQQGPDLSFVGVDAIQQLREQQEVVLEEAGAQAISGLSSDEFFERGFVARSEARTRVAALLDEQLDDYLQAHRFDRNTNPDMYLIVHGLLKTVSAHRMDSEKWNLGDPDEDGNHTRYETSGRAMVEATLAQFRTTEEENPTEPLGPEHAEQIEQAVENLEATRSALANLSVQRRRKARNNSKLEAAYTEAQKAYEAARTALGALRAQEWQHEEAEPTQVRANVVKFILDEHQNFTKAELEHLTEDPSRMARLSRRLARHKVLFIVGSGLAGAGIGYGIGYGTGKLAKGAIASAVGLSTAAALPIALAGGVAIKTTKAVLQSSLGNRVNQQRSQGARAQKDHAELSEEANGQINDSHSHEQMLATAHQLLTSKIDRRVRKDISSNRNRVLAAAAISGATGVAGFLEAGGADPLLDRFGLFGHHHPSGAVPQHPESGGGGTDSGDASQGNTPGGSGAGNTSNNPPAGGGNTPPPETTPQPGVVDGYQQNVTISHGEGYQQALKDLTDQKQLHLTDAQTWKLYQHLDSQFHGNLFTNNPSYIRPQGGFGISHAGAAQWNANAIHSMNAWLEENKLAS